jgi:hypothetical protein
MDDGLPEEAMHTMIIKKTHYYCSDLLRDFNRVMHHSRYRQGSAVTIEMG